MITHLGNAPDNEHEHNVENTSESETQKVGAAEIMLTGQQDKGSPLYCPLLSFSGEGGFKVDH